MNIRVTFEIYNIKKGKIVQKDKLMSVRPIKDDLVDIDGYEFRVELCKVYTEERSRMIVYVRDINESCSFSDWIEVN